VYFFDTDITQNVKYLFPDYEEYTNKILDKKAEIYIKIKSKDKIYQTIKTKLKARGENATWVSEKILYSDIVVSKPKRKTSLKQKSIEKKIYWKLEAVFHNKKVAIINGKMVKVSSIVDGAEVLKIYSNKVLLKYKKGKRWVYLFQ
jgi:hypothetical protein